jgi:RimJ/RimL family protein N-acetyltransferase
MRAPEPTTLVGGLVRLEPLGPQHVDDLFEAGQYDDVWTWLPTTRPRVREDMLRQVEHALSDPGRLPFAVIVEGQAVGTTSYADVDLSVSGLEIGFTWYTPSLWTTTVNPECKLLLFAHAFDDLGAGRVLLKTDALNTRSLAAIRKLGCRYDGTLRHHRRRPDGTQRLLQPAGDRVARGQGGVGGTAKALRRHGCATTRTASSPTATTSPGRSCRPRLPSGSPLTSTSPRSSSTRASAPVSASPASFSS